MLTVQEALALVLRHAWVKPWQTVPVCQALGTLLEQDILADQDSPPFTKSLVDGYAVRAADVANPNAQLALRGEIRAGQVALNAIATGDTVAVMTGAPLPEGAELVVMHEQTELVETESGPCVRFFPGGMQRGQNVMLQGTAFRQGATLVKAGTHVRPVELGLLAEFGVTQVRVGHAPKVAVLSTGDELVSADTKPGPGQIRNSNGPMLEALVKTSGATPIPLGIASDTAAMLAAKIEAGLDADLLLISGGVSAGVADLVPGLLKQAGVIEIFHKVRLKPGKPIWFGECKSSTRRALVFGLPGNPVSSLVCYYLFVRPAILKLRGQLHAGPATLQALLETGFSHRGERPTYHPAQMTQRGGQLVVTPLAWQGSADLCSWTHANAMIAFPSGNKDYLPGELVEVLPLADDNFLLTS